MIMSLGPQVSNKCRGYQITHVVDKSVAIDLYIDPPVPIETPYILDGYTFHITQMHGDIIYLAHDQTCEKCTQIKQINS